MASHRRSVAAISFVKTTPQPRQSPHPSKRIHVPLLHSPSLPAQRPEPRRRGEGRAAARERLNAPDPAVGFASKPLYAGQIGGSRFICPKSPKHRL